MSRTAYRRRVESVVAVQYLGLEDIETLAGLGVRLVQTEHWDGACGEAGCENNRTLWLVRPGRLVPWADDLVPTGCWVVLGEEGSLRVMGPGEFADLYEPEGSDE